MNITVIKTTCKDKKEAKKIANILLEKRLAACIQISSIESLYTWENRVCNEKEKLLLIKTKTKLFEKVKRKIKENHSYDVPEIILIDIKNSTKEYKKFIGENTK